jgi:hypothetical protein
VRGATGPEFARRFLPLVGLHDDTEIVHARVRPRRGVPVLSPSYGKVGLREVIPDIIDSLPRPLREKARKLAERRVPIPHLYHRRVVPHRLPVPYLPLTFFLLFTSSEQRTRLDPPGPSHEAGYVAGIGQARRRLDRVRAAAEATREEKGLLAELASLGEFLAPHAEDGLLEMRYYRPDDEPGESEMVREARARIRSAGRGVIFPGGVLSGLRVP